MLRSLLVLTLLFAAGCFHYVPVAPNGPEPDVRDRVRIHTAEPTEVRLVDYTAHDVTLIDGEVVRWADDRLLLSVWYLRSLRGHDHIGQGETAQVPRELIERVERRRLNLLATGGILAVVAILPYAIGRILPGAGGAQGGENGGGNTN